MIVTTAVTVKPLWSVPSNSGVPVAGSEAFKARMATSLVWASNVLGRQVKQKEVAEALTRLLRRSDDTPERTVSRYFQGRIPAVPMIEALAEAMHVDPGWLAFGEKSSAAPPPLPAAQFAELVPRPRKRKRA